MGSSDQNQRLVTSVLDRLRDDSTEHPGQSLQFDGEDLGQLTQAVGRDLENLLNTRRRCRSSPPQLEEVGRSVIEYGIPDFTGLNMTLPSERELTRLAIERAIRQFEPR